MLVGSGRPIHGIDLVSDQWITAGLDRCSLATQSTFSTYGLQTQTALRKIGSSGSRQMWPANVRLNAVAPLLQNMQQTLCNLSISSTDAQGEEEDIELSMEPVLLMHFLQLRIISSYALGASTTSMGSFLKRYATLTSIQFGWHQRHASGVA